MKKGLLYVVGFVYLILTLAFSSGLFYCLNALPPDPVLTDLHYTCFGIGLCALPAMLLAAGSVGFYCELSKEISLAKKDSPA